MRKSRLVSALASVVVIALAVGLARSGGGAESGSRQSATTSITSMVTIATSTSLSATTTIKMAVSRTTIPVPVTLAPNQTRAKAFARRAIAAAFRRFSKTLSPKEFIRARDEIAQRYPGVTMRLGGTESTSVVRLTGSIEGCFENGEERGIEYTREVPC